MSDKKVIYDELSKILTDYEGHGSEEGATAEDLYFMLVKIQRNWDIITSQDN